MRFLIIGLGSMGKRRIRNLQALEAGEILGFDLKKDRRKEVGEKYNIKTIGNLKDLDFNNVDAIFISTPPNKHNQYIKLAIDYKKPAFVEASAILEGLEKLNDLAKKKNIIILPSCTMRFHPAIKKIKEIVKGQKYGRVANFSYHMGQYLPDWHPWEKVKDFYAGKKKTGGGREMVTFELTWIVDILGVPRDIVGFYGKTMDIGTDIDDTFAISLDFGRVLGNLTVDVVSRYATRNLILNMEKAQILWRWKDNCLKLYEAENKKWKKVGLPKGKAFKGYNKNIIEKIYIDEIKSFLRAIKNEGKFPNSLDDDIKVLKLLYKVEKKI